MRDHPLGPALATFRPLGVGVRTGVLPVNVSWPFPRSFSIYREGLSFQLFRVETWIPYEEIEMIMRGRGLIRFIWSNRGAKASATISDWFRAGRIADALEGEGYRVVRS